MKKKLLLLFVVSALTGAMHLLQAQQDYRPKKGYVHLKNGTVLKGKYVYAPALDRIRVISGGETVVFSTDEIEKVSNGKGPDIVRVEGGEPFSYKPQRLFSLNELGILIGNADNELKAPFIFNTSLHFRLWRGLSAGAGTGIEIYKEAYLPVFAHAMYTFGNDRRVSPFVSLQGGYEIPLEGSRLKYADIRPERYDWIGPPPEVTDTKAKGGWLIHPSVGFTYQLSEGFAMGLSVGYRHHALRYKANEDYSMDVKYDRLCVKLGFIFN
ncbi:hypothetical protein [Tannerella sp.]|uniref:hypothetical protein n=1 Tax=Tannerella sp. TaxID=2382127 RepID=UPI0026DAC75D|nr:hypothetical protein [Tannerella sp.]MDO4703000.1 hypothetical protein [Tannerella sp.]